MTPNRVMCNNTHQKGKEKQEEKKRDGNAKGIRSKNKEPEGLYLAQAASNAA